MLYELHALLDFVLWPSISVLNASRVKLGDP